MSFFDIADVRKYERFTQMNACLPNRQWIRASWAVITRVLASVTYVVNFILYNYGA